jgi:tetratricopeptide (TPR) repeat protein
LLRDLRAERDAGDVDDADFAALEDDYTARAAAVIRAIETQQVAQAAATPPRSLTRRVLVWGAVVVFALGAGVLVARWSGSRGAGQSITGGIRTDTRDLLLEARQDFSQNPPQYLEAVKAYDQVLQQDPANVEALSYRGWMYRIVALQATGNQQQQLRSEAQASLAQALRTDPTDPTSLIFMSAVLDDLGQPRQALADLDRVPASAVPSVVTGLVSQLRSHLQSELGSTTTTGGSTTTTG